MIGCPSGNGSSIGAVSISKTIRLQLDADSEAAALAQVDEMCHKLLANPVIERYTVEIETLEPV